MNAKVNLACALMLAGCAHTPTYNVVSAGGVLEVINATREQIEVSCNGALLGTLKPKERKEFDRLFLGECRLEAFGHRSKVRHYTMTTLSENAKKSWRVDETKEQKEILDKLPKGKIKVKNCADEPLRVKIDDEPKELLWKASEVEYDGIGLGKHIVRAEGAKSGFVVETQVEVVSETVPVIEVFPPQGAIEIANLAPVEVNVMVAQELKVRLKPGETKRVPNMAVGQYMVRAEDNRFRVLFQGVATIKAGMIERIEIKAAEGMLAVVSEIDQELRIMADGRLIGGVPPRGASEFQGLPVGDTTLMAFSSDGALLTTKKISIPMEGKALWFIQKNAIGEGQEGFGQIRVRNERNEPVRVRIDGWERGDIGQGKQRVFPKIPTGVHMVDMYGVYSKDVFRAEVLVEEGNEAVVTTPLPTASVIVKNKRDEAVRLLVDGEEVATLGPQQETTILLTAGTHVLEHKGLSTLFPSLMTVRVLSGISNVVELVPPFASLRISNGFIETLHVVVDDTELGAVEPQSQATFSGLASGKHRVTLKAQNRPIEWSRDVVLKEGEVWEWRVPE